MPTPQNPFDPIEESADRTIASSRREHAAAIAARASQESELRLKALLDVPGSCSAIFDSTGLRLYASKSFCELEKELTPHITLNALGQWIVGSVEVDVIATGRENARSVFKRSVFPFRNDMGEALIGVMCVEVTDSVQFGEDLIGALNHSFDSICLFQPVYDNKGICVDFTVEMANDATACLVEIPVADMLGRKLSDLFPGAASLVTRYCEVMSTGIPSEIQFVFAREAEEVSVTVRVARVGDRLSTIARFFTESDLSDMKRSFDPSNSNSTFFQS